MVLIHVGILCATGVAIFISDSLAFAWVRGTTAVLDESNIRRLHICVGFGLAGMLISGLFLFLERPSELLASVGFSIKMTFVAVLVLNAFVIGYVSRIATLRTYASLTFREKLPLFIAGAISTLSWVGAFLAAFTLG